jgi:hypothetical protein
MNSPLETKETHKREEIEPTVEEKAFFNEIVALSQRGVLIRKGVVSVRMFSLEGNRTVVAFTLQETDDGYIVALPAILSPIGKEVTAEFISPTPIVKLHKSGIPIMAMPTPNIFFHYLRLSEEKFKSIPGYFNEERKSQITSIMIQISENFNIKTPTVAKAKPDIDIKPSQETPFKNLDSYPGFYINDKTNKYRH